MAYDHPLQVSRRAAMRCAHPLQVSRRAAPENRVIHENRDEGSLVFCVLCPQRFGSSFTLP